MAGAFSETLKLGLSSLAKQSQGTADGGMKSMWRGRMQADGSTELAMRDYGKAIVAGQGKAVSLRL